MANCVSAKCVTYDPCSGTPSAGFLRCLNTMPCAQVTCNCWLVATSQSCVQLRDMLKCETCPEDRLFVTECGPEAAWCNTIANQNCIRSILNSGDNNNSCNSCNNNGCRTCG